MKMAVGATAIHQVARTVLVQAIHLRAHQTPKARTAIEASPARLKPWAPLLNR